MTKYRKRTIVVIAKKSGIPISTWGQFNKCCEAYKLDYDRLRYKHFPIETDEYMIYKVIDNEAV